MGIEDNSERHEVSVAVSNDLRVYARMRWPLANDKFRKSRLEVLLGVSSRRIKSLWEGDQNAVLREREAIAIRKLIDGKKQRQIEEATRNDFQALQARIARLEAALLQRDPRPHSEQVAAHHEANYGRRRGDVAGPARR